MHDGGFRGESKGLFTFTVLVLGDAFTAALASGRALMLFSILLATWPQLARMPPPAREGAPNHVK